MAYTPEQKESILNSIFISMTDEGLSARKAVVKAGISSQTFWAWLDDDKDKSNQYARACEARSELKFDSIEEDYSAVPNYDEYGKVDSGWVALQRLKIDAKKWELSKLNPKKYGDKVDVTSGGDKISSAPTAINIGIVRPPEEE